MFVRLCVVQSAVTSYIYMRRLDFPYKKRTQIPSKTSKVNLTRTRGAGTSGQPGTSGLKLHQVALLHCSCRSHMASDRDGPKSKVVDLETEKNSLVDHFLIRSHLEVEFGPAKLQIMLKLQFSGRPACKVSVQPGTSPEVLPGTSGADFCSTLFWL